MRSFSVLFAATLCTVSYAQSAQRYLAQSISSEIRTSATMVDKDQCLQREKNCKDSLAAQTELANQLKANLDDEERAHTTKLENLKNQCDAQEQAHTARQTELENELEITKQALEVARNNHTACVEEWNQKPFTYLGCYTDNVSNRVLADVMVTDDSITIAKCAKICQSFRYHGLENGRECFCGNALRGNPAAQPSKCDKPCQGYTGAKCGGWGFVGIHQKTI
ncbi:hypothetical protein J4E91_009682 [Alternaria rosae]|nr:hypothetical protein J4E91_009682 [Alternaria rosae]